MDIQPSDDISCIKENQELFESRTPDYSRILLGERVEHDEAKKISQKSEKGNIFSLFKLATLKKITTFSVVSVKSLYQKFIIRDSSIIKKYWDIIMELILSYDVITTLFFLAYQNPSGGMLVVDYITWIFFIVDIGLTFFTEKINERGLPIREFKDLSLIYLKGYLLLDIIAIIPVRLGGGDQRIEYYLRMVRLLKLPGIIDLTDGTGISFLLTYFSFGKREKDGRVTYTYTAKIIASLIKLLITVIFLVYFLGCFFFWFQAIVNNYQYSQNPAVLNENNFQNAYITDGMDVQDIALRSSYFMLTTIATIGYGDFLPQNIYEMSFIMCVMLFGVTLFAYIMGNFNNAINYYNEATSGVDYIGSLNTWLDSLERLHGKIPKELRKKIIDHFTFYFSNDRLKSLAKSYWDAETADDLVAIDQDYVSLLPEEIYYQVIGSLFKDFLYHFSYFSSEKLKYALLPHLQPRKFEQSELIYTHNTHITELMFVMSGNISIGIDIEGKHTMLLFCENGRTILGEYCIITKLKNKFDYLAQTRVVAYVINADVFLKILESFYPEEKNKILAMSVTRENNLKRLLNDHLKDSRVDFTVLTEIYKDHNTIIPSKAQTNDHYSEEDIEMKLAAMDSQTFDIEKDIKKVVSTLDSLNDLRKSSFLKLNKPT